MLLIYPTNFRSKLPFIGSAGKNRGLVKVDITGLPDSYQAGQVLPGTVKLQTSEKTALLEYVPADVHDRLVVVVLHRDSAGTFWGAGIGSVEPQCSHQYDSFNQCERRYSEHRLEGHDFVAGSLGLFVDAHPSQKWEGKSYSGGANVYAGVFVLLPSDPNLTLITSGYKGREKVVHIISPTGDISTTSYQDYVAGISPPVTL